MKFELTAQDVFTQNPSPPAPTAAAFSKYGDIPVSYHTGVPNISIPLYTITEGDISIPISLSYHSSGIKVNETASWVGLGWSLNAGGAITRSVQGIPDEGLGSPVSGKGWYQDENLDVIGKGGLTALLESTPCITNPNDAQGVGPGPCRQEYDKVIDKKLDTEPDVFSFNINGYTGKFFFDENRVAHLQPKQDIKITPTYDVSAREFTSWKITTPDGMRYYFGGVTATENTFSGYAAIPNTNDFRNLTSTTWYLTKVENVNATKSITFNYETEEYSYTNRPSHTATLKKNPSSIQGNLQNILSFLNFSLVKGKRLSSISTSSGLVSVDFIANTIRTDLSGHNFSAYNSEGSSLDTLRTRSGEEIKEFTFSYDYFVGDSTDTNEIPPSINDVDLRRLKLLSIQERGKKNATAPFETKPRHEFSYEESTIFPRRLSLARDYWGYFNGKMGNSGLIFYTDVIGDYTNLTSGLLADRDPVIGFMKAGILKQITYPTGGYSEFEYEAHKLLPSSSTIYGGLRIKKISNYSSPGVVATVKEFTYPQGILHIPDPRNNSRVISFEPGKDNQIGTTIQHTFGSVVNSEPNVPLSASLGYHVGYSIIEVSTISHSNPTVTNGKIRYSFYNPNPVAFVQNQYPSVPSEFNPIHGKQYQEIVYTDSGNVILEKTNNYFTDFSNIIKARRVVQNDDFILFRDYDIKIGRTSVVLEKMVTDGVVSSKSYEYSPKHNLPVKETVINTDGTSYITETDYNFDLLPSCSYSGVDSCKANYILATNALRQEAWNNSTIVIDIDNEQDVTVACDTSLAAYSAGSLVYLACNTETSNYFYNNVQGIETTYNQCVAQVSADYEACLDEAINSVNTEDQALARSIRSNWRFPTEQRVFEETTQIGGYRTKYVQNEHDHLIPSELYKYETTGTGGNWQLRNSISFNSQNMPSEQLAFAGQPNAFLWGYGHTRPTAQTLNASENEVAYTSFEMKNEVSEVENGGWILNDPSSIITTSESETMVWPNTNYNGTWVIETSSGGNATINIDLQVLPQSSNCAELVITSSTYNQTFSIQSGSVDFTISLVVIILEGSFRIQPPFSSSETSVFISKLV
ncbi:MAG: hypothetical protein AAF655_26745 [Bacteroidota bacterium]